MSNLIMIAGILLLCLSAFMKYSEKRTIDSDKTKIVAAITPELKTEIESDLDTNIVLKENLSPEVVPGKQDLETGEKGIMFEKYIIQKFSKKYYKIKEWRGDKIVNGIHPESSKLPDMEIELNLHNFKKLFAIECKWRKQLYKNQIEIEEYKLKNYKAYEDRTNIQVFVVLGLGGKPSLPDMIYVIPLKELNKNILTKQELSKYFYSDINKDFYYDKKTNLLEASYY